MKLPNRSSQNRSSNTQAKNQAEEQAHGNRELSQHESHTRNQQLLKVSRRLFLAGAVVTASGCQKLIGRGQSPDTAPLVQLYDENVSKTKYIGDICGIYGLNFAKVDGIGLAVGLDGTGSPAKPGSQRDQLIRDLEINKDVKDGKALVRSKDTELVVMYGLLPPGIRKGETFDLKVTVLGSSEATSLENGTLLISRLRPLRRLGKGVRQGHVTALGKGGIIVDATFDTRQDRSKQLHGVILGGGKALEDRPLGLAIRTDEFTPKTTTEISRAINSRFTALSSQGRKGVAEPKTDKRIELLVPDGYRLNVGRYLSVVKNLAYSEPVEDRINRLEQLEREMGQPTLSGETALKLEAIGKQGIPALKRALGHSDLEVQFHAAEALAYSGHADGVEILVKAAREEPAFRWHAMTALASFDDVSTGIGLSELMQVESAETRYGAFRAMRARSPHDPLVSGDWLAGDFHLHEIPSEASPMIHFSRAKRPEIVLFGNQQTLVDDFLHVEPGLTVKGNGNGTVSVNSYSAKYGEDKIVCSNKISEVIRALAKLGYGYGALVNMFRTANQADALNTRLVVNAVPKLGRTYSPDESIGQLAPEKSDRYVAQPLPELFRDGQESKTKTKKRRVQEETVGQIDKEIAEEQGANDSHVTRIFKTLTKGGFE